MSSTDKKVTVIVITVLLIIYTSCTVVLLNNYGKKDVKETESVSKFDDMKVAAEFESNYGANEIGVDIGNIISVDWMIGHYYNDKNPKEVHVETFDTVDSISGDIPESLQDMYISFDYEKQLLAYINKVLNKAELALISVTANERYCVIGLRNLSTDKYYVFAGVFCYPDSPEFTVLYCAE